MKIVVLVKHVPEPTAVWRFSRDLTLDRAGIEGRLSQLDEYAVEQAVRLAERDGDTEITCLTMGPAPAVEGLRAALAMGGQRGVHVLDDALPGSDALATSLVLAAAVRRLEGDLVVCGMASTDAEMSVVPSMVAERLGVPQATRVHALSADAAPNADTTLTCHRDTDDATEEIAVSLPAVVSISDRGGEPRYPTFRDIMAARKKPVETWSLADLGIDPAAVGLAAAGTVVRDTQARPPREAGTVIVDEGDAAARLADFLTTSTFA